MQVQLKKLSYIQKWDTVAKHARLRGLTVDFGQVDSLVLSVVWF